MNNKPQTPLEKLITEKNRVRQLAKAQEVKINEHFTYVQANAGSLLLSFLSSMLFSKKEDNDTTSTETVPANSTAEPFSFADLLPMTKFLVPVIWDIAKPILLSWGIKKATTFVSQLFSRKKALVNN